MIGDPIHDDVPSFEDEETNEYTFDDDVDVDDEEEETTWEWNGEAWNQVH